MLLKEYALEPEVLGKRINWQILVPQIGASQGRLVARFPKDWKKRVYDAARKAAKPTELAWIEEKLRRLGPCYLFACGREGGDPSRPWLDNALAEHQREPFAAVLGLGPHQGVLAVDDLDDQSGPWKATRQCEVPRAATRMADAIRLLFMSGRNFKLIDPHLDLTKRRYQRTLSELLNRIANRPIGADKVRVECHVMTDGNFEKEAIFISNFEVKLKEHVPLGITVSLHFHPSDRMHDRFVLAEWTGVDFGQGLDEGDNPPLVKISLLEEEMRQRIWEQYPSDHPAVVCVAKG